MAHIERARWAWHGNIDYHVALRQQFLTQTIALAAYDEGHVFRQLRFVDAGGVVGGFDGDDGFAFGHNLVQIGFFAEIPADVVAA